MPTWFHYELSLHRGPPSAIRSKHLVISSAVLNYSDIIYRMLHAYRLVGSNSSLSSLTAHLRGRRIVYKRPDGTECLYADAYCLRKLDLLDGYSRIVVDPTMTLEEFKQIACVHGNSDQFKLIDGISDSRTFENRLLLALRADRVGGINELTAAAAAPIGIGFRLADYDVHYNSPIGYRRLSSFEYPSYSLERLRLLDLTGTEEEN